jgi:type II secretory pathway component PulF
MALSISDKAILYRELAKLVNADFHLDRAVVLLLGQDPPAQRRDFLQRLQTGLARGQGIASAMEQENMANTTGMERALVSAGERSGRLGECLSHLERYFSALDAGVRQARGALLYPILLAHLAMVLPELPAAASAGDWSGVLPRVIVLLGMFWAMLFLAWRAWRALSAAGASSAAVDRWLGKIPLAGGVRRHWALARFAQVFHSGLLAAMRVSEVALIAGEASQSGRFLAGARAASAKINTGGTLASSLGDTGAFPRPFVDGVATAEEAGTVDREMLRWAELETQEAREATQRAAEWLPRLFYALVALYVIYRIVSMFMGIYAPLLQDAGAP